MEDSTLHRFDRLSPYRIIASYPLLTQSSKKDAAILTLFPPKENGRRSSLLIQNRFWVSSDKGSLWIGVLTKIGSIMLLPPVLFVIKEHPSKQQKQ